MKWLRMLVGMACCLGACDYPPEKTPPDFLLEYAAGPVHADRSGHTFIRIRPSAADSPAVEVVCGVRSRVLIPQEGRLLDREDTTATGTLLPDDARPLYDAIVLNRFWRLKDRYVDRDILDGSYERLKIRAGGREKTVVLVNKANRRFRGIVDALEALTDPQRNPKMRLR